MNNKNISKIILLCIILTLSTVATMPVSANEIVAVEEDERGVSDSNYISGYYTTIDTQSDGYLLINSHTRTLQKADLTIDIILQVYENGSWKTVKTWFKSGTGLTLSSSISYKGTKGKQYRAKACHSVKVGNVTESRTVISATKVAK